jgi:hypothetical protein
MPPLITTFMGSTGFPLAAEKETRPCVTDAGSWLPLTSGVPISAISLTSIMAVPDAGTVTG